MAIAVLLKSESCEYYLKGFEDNTLPIDALVYFQDYIDSEEFEYSYIKVIDAPEPWKKEFKKHFTTAKTIDSGETY